MIAPHTVYLKTLMENEVTKPLLDKALSTYPMYEGINARNFGIIPTRSELNSKLLNHYKYREIAFETPGRFLDELEIAMNEIMSKYYGLYKSLDILNGIEDPFGNVDIKEIYEEERSGSVTGNTNENLKENVTGSTESEANSTSTTESNTASGGRSVKSDTPQSKLNELGEDISTTGIYASEVNYNDNKANDSATNTGNDTTNTSSSNERTNVNSLNSNTSTSDLIRHTLTKIGNQGVNTYAHDLLELRELFINIEQQIINDERIQELFFMLY